jgi:opacity protein-like surface antigen
VGGGPIYIWRHFRNFHPYGKGIVSFGVIDFRIPNSTYNYDSRTVLSAGIGFEYRAYRNVWARADYEYQDWPHLFGQTLDPQGFTVGASYHFSRPHLH